MNQPGNSAKFFTLQTLSYLEKDLVSFEAVARNNVLEGKLGVAMITNACAAMNLFAWLLHQRFGKQLYDAELFKALIEDRRFFEPEEFINHSVLYQLVRCGVIHQFYPKDVIIAVVDCDEVFAYENGKLIVNAMAFYRRTVRSLRKITNFIGRHGAEEDELRDYDLKLQLRQKVDEEAANAARIDYSGLPTRLGTGTTYEH